MTPIPVNYNGVDFAVTGHFERGAFVATSVRAEGAEVLPLLSIVGELRRIEGFAEWELRTAPGPR